MTICREKRKRWREKKISFAVSVIALLGVALQMLGLSIDSVAVSMREGLPVQRLVEWRRSGPSQGRKSGFAASHSRSHSPAGQPWDVREEVGGKFRKLTGYDNERMPAHKYKGTHLPGPGIAQ